MVQCAGEIDFKRERLQVSTEPFDPELPEVLFEIVAMGNSVKASAIDPVTNLEVSVVGPPTASPYNLKMNALRKLKARLRKLAAQEAATPLKGNLI